MLQNYVVDGEGINHDVMIRDIGMYLGPEASVSKGIHKVCTLDMKSVAFATHED